MDALTRKRLSDVAAMALIGDGVIGLIAPAEHCRIWDVGPKPCRELIETFVRHPNLTRFIAAAEVGFGTWLAASQLSRQR